MTDARNHSMSKQLKRSALGPVIYGHRGARGELAENTMEGFRHLVDLGISAVEIDVRLAAEGIPVVFHDAQIAGDMARDVNGRWLPQAGPAILHSTVAQLHGFDIGTLKPGSTLQQRFPEQALLDEARIPTLTIFCEWAAGQPDLFINIEIKSSPLEPTLGASPRALAESVIAMMERHGLQDRVLISSFDWRVLTACKALAPQLPRGYLSELGQDDEGDPPNIIDGSDWMDGLSRDDHGGSLPRVIQAAGGRVWAPYFKDITQADVREAQDLGLIVNVWTVNEIADIRRMADYGVDGIITDYPTRALALLADQSPNNKSTQSDSIERETQ